ncbi:ATP-binding protein [Rathayibacter caricis DSM 15933]|uniref:ATP-binding protein n=1 Tax=Rathayibacter caricis DSM 15933 TaxID=1328867 RepID=A0A2T4USP1_9MICO|nr:sce7725 family protein [Rathayibacter caricis]PTL72526.1 ATP-binding protein [Rathayibacter caricis DSM 15933]
MYYPYFRGKQFELIALRESASLIADANFVPIIEPVRETLTGLERALRALSDAGARAIVIVNPRHGDMKANGTSISSFLEQGYRGNDAVAAGALLLSDTSIGAAESLINHHSIHPQAIIHAGFTEPKALALLLGEQVRATTNIFIEDQASTLYRRHFQNSTRVLIKDGFVQRKNADYDAVDLFSDLHVTYGEFGAQGYGDFLTVGDRYAEGGGPAYAVAIHLTFIDPDNDDAMFVYHFKSDSNDTPTDPAGKFFQALRKLMDAYNSGTSKLLSTSAIQEFRDLYETGHFPGLGYVKKLSIRHHLETLADYHCGRANA